MSHLFVLCEVKDQGGRPQLVGDIGALLADRATGTDGETLRLGLQGR